MRLAMLIIGGVVLLGCIVTALVAMYLNVTALSAMREHMPVVFRKTFDRCGVLQTFAFDACMPRHLQWRYFLSHALLSGVLLVVVLVLLLGDFPTGLTVLFGLVAVVSIATTCRDYRRFRRR